MRALLILTGKSLSGYQELLFRSLSFKMAQVHIETEEHRLLLVYFYSPSGYRVPIVGPSRVWKTHSLKACYKLWPISNLQLRVNYGINCLTNSRYQSMHF